MPTEVNKPSLKNTRALVTTRWGNRGYRPITVSTIESYYVDTSIDNDSDTWTMDIGDPKGRYLALFDRDNEIRVQLFGVGRTGGDFIMTGFADEVSYDLDGSITFTGRDLSALATDSVAPGTQFRMKTAWSIIQKQAREIGFSKFALLHAEKKHRKFYTDGSESYWEFWYRMQRKDKQFLWCEPNGRLVGGPLHYRGTPTYYFGKPHARDPSSAKGKYLPIEVLEIHKSTQSRVGEVWVLGQRGTTGFLEKVKDPKTSAWVKRPRKLVQDKDATSKDAARKAAREEIYEGKVGSVEIKVTVADPGFIIRQNHLARINIPEIGLRGDYFVVGTRYQASPSGFVQEVRLRERYFAMSSRVPDDPKLGHVQAPQGEDVITSLSAAIAELGLMPEEWGGYFVTAAKEHHGPWDFNLFLATLLAMCEGESHFQNVREGDDTEWFFPPVATAQDRHRHGEEAPRMTLQEYHEIFANAGDNPLNPYRHRDNPEAGVGPMQLTSTSLKHDADDHFRANYRLEYVGGRWRPEHNIWASAKYLRYCLKQTVADSGVDNQIWMGVSGYNHGPGGATPGDAYSNGVKNRVMKSPGYLSKVTAALQAARNASTDDPYYTGTDSAGASPNGKYAMPLAEPGHLERSEFSGVDPEGAPDKFGTKHHAGKDWYAPGGSTIFAPAAGKLVELTFVDMKDPDHDLSGQVFGGEIKVQMANGNVWSFRHVNPVKGLKLKQRVDAGATIGHVCRWSDNPASSHAHIEFWLKYLDGRGYFYENMRDPVKMLTEK